MLDSSIKEDKRPLTWCDIENANQYIGSEGFFADELMYYSWLPSKEIERGVLSCVYSTNHPFRLKGGSTFRYFLPRSFLKNAPVQMAKPADDEGQLKQLLEQIDNLNDSVDSLMNRIDTLEKITIRSAVDNVKMI